MLMGRGGSNPSVFAQVRPHALPPPAAEIVERAQTDLRALAIKHRQATPPRKTRIEARMRRIVTASAMSPLEALIALGPLAEQVLPEV